MMSYLSPMNWVAMFISSGFFIFILAFNTMLNKNHSMVVNHSLKLFLNKAKY